MDIRLKREDILNAIREDLKSRGLAPSERTSLVLLINGSEITDEFLVEVRDVDLPSKSSAPTPRAPRATVRAEQPPPAFVPEETGEERELGDPFEEQAGGEETDNDQGVDDAIEEALNNGGDDQGDFSDDQNLRGLLDMMSPKDRQKAVALQKKQSKGHSLTRAPTAVKTFRSLREAGKAPGDIGDEI